jgi:hypothetical protein
MHVLSIPCVIMAAINFYVGAYYLFFYMKRPQIREHLPFALLCLSVGFYDVSCAGLYNSLSIHDGILWQRLQFDTVVAISVSLIWFTGIFTGQKGNRIIQFLIVWFIIILFASLFGGPGFSLSPDNPAVKHIHLPDLPKITYYEGVVGIIYQIEIISIIIAYIYLFCLFINYYLRTGNKILVLIIFSQIIYFLGVVNDSLVAMRFYSFIYISEYAFFFIIIAMAYTLLDKFVDLHKSFEELNANLEQKVSDRTREILEAQSQVKRLEGIIPICMYCKKIRDDKESWYKLEQYITEHSEAVFSHGVCPECLEKLE